MTRTRGLTPSSAFVDSTRDLFKSRPPRLSLPQTSPRMNVLNLTDPAKWSYRQSPHDALSAPALVVGSDSSAPWTTCTQMPSQIHVELIAARTIPDPFKQLHEKVRTSSRPRWTGRAELMWGHTLSRTSSGLARRTGSTAPASSRP